MPVNDTIFDKGGAVYNVKASGYGVFGDGTTPDQAALDTLANSTMQPSGGTLVFPPTTYRIASNLTFPANVSVVMRAGAILKLDAGATVTIAGPFDGDASRHFDLSADPSTTKVVPTGMLNVRWFGAKGDGSDVTTALQSAVTVAKALAASLAGKQSGVTLYFPRGVYKCSTSLNFDNSASITLRGDGGLINGDQRSASTLIYTGSGATTASFVSARSTAGFSIRDMAVLYDNSSFLGMLIDFSHSSGGSDSSRMTIANCTLGADCGVATTEADALICLDNAIIGRIENCTIGFCKRGIRGIRNNLSGYSNQHSIRSCTFIRCSVGAIVNPYEAWTISGNTFEGTGLTRALWHDIEKSVKLIAGLNFSNNWLGDTSGPAHAWVDPNKARFLGATFSANHFGTVLDPVTGSMKDSIRVGSCGGVTIIGNTLGTVDFSVGSATVPNGVSIIGNELQSGNTVGAPFFRNLDPDSVNVCMFGNYAAGFAATSFDQLWLSGHIVTAPILGNDCGSTPLCVSRPATVDATATQAQLTVTLDGGAHPRFASNDTAGRVEFRFALPPISTSPGAQATIKFGHAYYDPSTGATKPKVLLMPENKETAAEMSKVWVETTATGFAIHHATGMSQPASGEPYRWSYFVVQ